MTQPYTINYQNQVITLNRQFSKAASTINTPEYRTLVQLKRDFAEYAINVRTIERKENKKSYSRLTYDAMRKYIGIKQGNDSDALKNLEKIIALMNQQKGSYAKVKNWFLKQFPDYGDPTSVG